MICCSRLESEKWKILAERVAHRAVPAAGVGAGVGSPWAWPRRGGRSTPGGAIALCRLRRKTLSHSIEYIILDIMFQIRNVLDCLGAILRVNHGSALR